MGHLSTPGPDTGFFSTREVPGQGQKFSRTIGIPKGQYGPAPFIRTGLNAINCDNPRGNNLRFSASVTNVSPTSFDIVAETWNNSSLDEATLTWIELKGDAKDTQAGWWQSNDSSANQHKTFNVRFGSEFQEPPVIVLWFHYLDLINNSQWRIHTYASNVTNKGFTVNIDTWNNNQVYKAGVTWIAYKKGKLDIASGRFAEPTSKGQRQPQKTREIAFSSGKFVAPPTVLSGLSMIDHTSATPLTLASVAKDVTAKGFTWSLETKTPWACSAEYIAIGQTPSLIGQASPSAELSTSAQVEIKDDKEIHAQRDDWIVQRARSLEQLRASLSEWEDNLKKREAAIEEANGKREAAAESRESAAKEREAALVQREEAVKQREADSASQESAMSNGVDHGDEHEATISQLQQEIEQLKLQLAEASSKRAPMRPSKARVEDEGEEDMVEPAKERPPIQPPARELPAGNLNWGFDSDLLRRFNEGMQGRDLMRPSRREREAGAVW